MLDAFDLRCVAKPRNPPIKHAFGTELNESNVQDRVCAA
jgi:hypothetical protein